MRPTTTTTVATYGILMLAGSIPLAMPDSLAQPVIPAARAANDARVVDVSAFGGCGMWSRPYQSGSAASLITSPFASFD